VCPYFLTPKKYNSTVNIFGFYLIIQHQFLFLTFVITDRTNHGAFVYWKESGNVEYGCLCISSINLFYVAFHTLSDPKARYFGLWSDFPFFSTKKSRMNSVIKRTMSKGRLYYLWLRINNRTYKSSVIAYTDVCTSVHGVWTFFYFSLFGFLCICKAFFFNICF